jgi:hypothetical protein
MTELDWFGSSNPHSMLAFLATQHVRRRWSWVPWFGSRDERCHSRKRLLFALACCRRIERCLADERCRQALELAERYVDGQATHHDWKRAAAAAAGAALDASSPHIGVGGWLAAAQARAAEAVAAALNEHDPANVAAARAKDAIRAWMKGSAIAKPKPTAAAPTPPPENSWNSSIIIAGTNAADPSPSSTPNVPPAEIDAWAKEAQVQCQYLRDIFGNPFRQAGANASVLHQSRAIVIAERIYRDRGFGQMPALADALTAEGYLDAEVIAHCRQTDEHVRGCWVIDLLLGKSPQ